MYSKLKAPLNAVLFFILYFISNLLVAQQVNPENNIENANSLLQQGDSEQAINVLNEIARSSSDQANFAKLRLAILYKNGDDVSQDLALACQWFVEAAEDLPVAIQETGHCYASGTLAPVTEAIKWYNKAIEYGLPGALCDIGALYYKGVGVEKDKQQAVQYCIDSSNAGTVSAQAVLGAWFMDDKELRDIQKAQGWLEQAAPYHGESAFRLASLIEKHSNRHEVALYWYEKAASLAYIPAYQVTAQAYFFSHANAKGQESKFLAKAYLWSQVWKAQKGNDVAVNWVNEIEDLTPPSWHAELNKKVAEHLNKFSN